RAGEPDVRRAVALVHERFRTGRERQAASAAAPRRAAIRRLSDARGLRDEERAADEWIDTDRVDAEHGQSCRDRNPARPAIRRLEEGMVGVVPDAARVDDRRILTIDAEAVDVLRAEAGAGVEP